jgi:hypothetical protein
VDDVAALMVITDATITGTAGTNGVSNTIDKPIVTYTVDAIGRYDFTALQPDDVIPNVDLTSELPRLSERIPPAPQRSSS